MYRCVKFCKIFFLQPTHFKPASSAHHSCDADTFRVGSNDASAAAQNRTECRRQQPSSARHKACPYFHCGRSPPVRHQAQAPSDATADRGHEHISPAFCLKDDRRHERLRAEKFPPAVPVPARTAVGYRPVFPNGKHSNRACAPHDYAESAEPPVSAATFSLPLDQAAHPGPAESATREIILKREFLPS